MTHLFLSPHPDDVVLSCGGTLYELIKTGEPVAVYTLMAGDAPVPLPFSDLIDRIHARWRLGKNPMPGRRAEDVLALGQYDLPAYFGEWLDCIYRENHDFQALLYPDDDAIFGDIHLQDPLQSVELDLSAWDNIQAIYVPLAAGNHVDHQLVRQWALKWHKTAPTVAFFFYEEYPYSSENHEVYRSHAGVKTRLSGATAVEAAIQTLASSLQAQVRSISDQAIQVKLAAMRCYASQMSTFWQNTAEMAQSMITYVQQVGRTANVAAGERFWHFTH